MNAYEYIIKSEWIIMFNVDIISQKWHISYILGFHCFISFVNTTILHIDTA